LRHIEGNVDRAGSPRRAHDRALTITAIPDAEIRTYVRTVQGAERASRRTYVSALHN